MSRHPEWVGNFHPAQCNIDWHALQGKSPATGKDEKSGLDELVNSLRFHNTIYKNLHRGISTLKTSARSLPRNSISHVQRVSVNYACPRPSNMSYHKGPHPILHLRHLAGKSHQLYPKIPQSDVASCSPGALQGRISWRFRAQNAVIGEDFVSRHLGGASFWGFVSTGGKPGVVAWPIICFSGTCPWRCIRTFYFGFVPFDILHSQQLEIIFSRLQMNMV